jgi:hypothetical protein
VVAATSAAASVAASPALPRLPAASISLLLSGLPLLARYLPRVPR